MHSFKALNKTFLVTHTHLCTVAADVIVVPTKYAEMGSNTDARKNTLQHTLVAYF